MKPIQDAVLVYGLSNSSDNECVLSIITKIFAKVQKLPSDNNWDRIKLSNEISINEWITEEEALLLGSLFEEAPLIYLRETKEKKPDSYRNGVLSTVKIVWELMFEQIFNKYPELKAQKSNIRINNVSASEESTDYILKIFQLIFEKWRKNFKEYDSENIIREIDDWISYKQQVYIRPCFIDYYDIRIGMEYVAKENVDDPPKNHLWDMFENFLRKKFLPCIRKRHEAYFKKNLEEDSVCGGLF